MFLHAGTFSLTVPASRFLVFSANTVGEFKGQILTALNLPAFIVELLLSVRTWPTTWQPSGFTLWGWRALTFPIFALPAWYYIGVGIDGLLGSVGLHVWNAIVSSLFAAACAILGGGLTVALPAADREPGLKWITAGFMLWALLFGTVVVASVRQGRPKAAIFAQVLIGLVFGIVVLWIWTNSRIPLWEVSNPDGSYSIGWRSGIVAACVMAATQLLSWFAFKKFVNGTSGAAVRENPA